MTAIGGKLAIVKRPGELGVGLMDAPPGFDSNGVGFRDPRASYSEYSADVDYIPSICDWDLGDDPLEDSIYLWGPEMPSDFIVNHEIQA